MTSPPVNRSIDKVLPESLAFHSKHYHPITLALHLKLKMHLQTSDFPVNSMPLFENREQKTQLHTKSRPLLT